MPNVLTLRELTGDEILTIIQRALAMKTRPADYADALADRTLLMLFQKTSTRTRLSFELGIQELGGRAVVLDWQASNFAIAPLEHEMQSVAPLVDLILARLLSHEDLVSLASAADVPTINGCCNRYHPTQALTDLMTVYEIGGDFAGVTLGYIGMQNNVANALVAGALRVGLRLVLVVPRIHAGAWDGPLLEEAVASGLVTLTDEPDALRAADFVYTDAWQDMERFNQPEHAEEQERLAAAMAPYRLRAELFDGKDPYVMHAMPAHPGFEIEASLLESERSLVYRQAANKLHVGKSLMLHLLDVGAPATPA